MHYNSRSNKHSVAISYLELFISQAQGDPSQRVIESQACNQLGNLYSKQGRHDLAVLYFDRHFHLLNGSSTKYDAAFTAGKSQPDLFNSFNSLTVATNPVAPVAKMDNSDVNCAMIQLGISKANAQMDVLFETVADPYGVQALIGWKNTRSFGEYLPPAHRVQV